MKPPSLVKFLLGLLVLGPVLAWSQPVLQTDPLTQMTLRQKVGQLFVIGFSEKSIDPRLEKFIRGRNPGGFILFRRNLGGAEQIRAFTQKLSSIGREVGIVDPFLAVDQEGGPVTRVPFFPSLPSAYAIGASQREDLARSFGEESGRLLRWAGFNLNLAPVLDLSSPTQPSFLGPRSFGDDPTLTGKMGLAYAEGLRRAGILPTGKHFPGLGGVVGDLHKNKISSKADPSLFRQKDLKPFSTFAELGPTSALMISQMSYPFLDPSGTPACFSSKILKDILCTELGFQGLVMTDDLQMKGSSLVHKPEEAALVSLKAGADLIMISWSFQDQIRAMDRVEKAVENGEWPIDELDSRVKRILAVKKNLVPVAEPLPLKISIGPNGNPGTKHLEELDLNLLDSKLPAQKTRTPAAIAPLKNSEKVCVVSADDRFLVSFRQARPQRTQTFLLAKEMGAPEIEALLPKSCAKVVFAVNGKKTGFVLSSLALATRLKTYAVNLSLPSVLPAPLKFAGRIEVGYPHLHAGFRVAQLLK